MRKNFPLLASIILALFSLGCSTTARMGDLKDCGKVSVAVGHGLTANIKLGGLSHMAIGAVSDTRHFGHESRTKSGSWDEIEITDPLLTYVYISTKKGSVLRSLNCSYDRGKFFGREHDDYIIGQWIQIPWHDHYNPWSFSSITDMEMSVVVGPIGGRIGVNPLEIVDLLLGFVGIDIGRDDMGIRSGTGRRSDMTTNADDKQD